MIGTTPGPEVHRRRGEVAAGGIAVAVAVVLIVADPARAGVVMIVLAVAVATVTVALHDPVLAVLLLVTATFLRAAVSVPGLPQLPLLGLALALAAVVVAVGRGRLRLPPAGPIEIVMAAYLAWNLLSWLIPHTYPAMARAGDTEAALVRYLLSGTILPFAAYLLGRTVMTTQRARDRLLWLVVGLSAYSAWVSIVQFHGPRRLLWPRSIGIRPGWTDRAVGVFDQPVVNGLVLVVGCATCLYLLHRGGTPTWTRALLYGVAAASGYGVYLTHTRAVWLALAVVLVAGAVLGRDGHRRDCLSAIGAIGVLVAANWATFVGSDRAAGGIGSTNELADRLNLAATGLWGIARSPVTGWGLGRFAAVNTAHHQQWDPSVDWRRGYAQVAHNNELGVATDLGLVGLVLWVTVLVLLLRTVWRALRTLPTPAGRGLALLALVTLIAYVVVGTTVDLRFLDFANFLAFLIVGTLVGTLDRSPPERRAPGTPVPTLATSGARS